MAINIFDHIFFGLIGIGIPLLSILSNARHPEIDEVELELPPKKHLYYSNALMLLIGALLVITLWNVYGRSYVSLGFAYPKITPNVIVISVLILLIYLYDAFRGYLKYRSGTEEEESLSHIMPTTWQDFLHFIPLAFAAGICEEVVYRGFLCNYLFQICQSSDYCLTIVILFPAIVFSISHLYQGWQAVFKILLISLLFSLLFVISQSLLFVMIIHVFVDLFSGFLMVLASKRADS